MLYYMLLLNIRKPTTNNLRLASEATTNIEGRNTKMKDVAQAAQLMSTGNKRLCTGSVNSDPTENHFCGAALKSPVHCKTRRGM